MVYKDDPTPPVEATMAGKSDVPRLLRLAFELAKKGEVEGAMQAWQSAIDKGYQIRKKTAKSLDRIIQKWLQERSTLPEPVSLPDFKSWDP
jgi:hypothetical protein